eukprot:UN05092
MVVLCVAALLIIIFVVFVYRISKRRGIKNEGNSSEILNTKSDKQVELVKVRSISSETDVINIHCETKKGWGDNSDQSGDLIDDMQDVMEGTDILNKHEQTVGCDINLDNDEEIIGDDMITPNEVEGVVEQRCKI